MPNPDPRFYLLRDTVCSDFDSANQLIANDPSILHAKNGIGETAFHFLVVEDAKSAVDFLRLKGSKVDTVNNFGDTPLADAAALGYLAMCNYLVNHGANFRHISIKYDESAYSRAALSNQIDVLTYLLNLLSIEEDLNKFFSSAEIEVILTQNNAVSELLVKRGLRSRWNENG